MSAFWLEAPLEELPTRLPDAETSGVLWQATESALMIDVPGLARCAAHRGEPVRAARAAAAHAVDLRLFVQGLPLAAYWVQRGRLALHAAAIATPRGAVVFAGISGMGKSTLAAFFGRQGCALLADEVTAIDTPQPGRLHVLPSMGDVLLWNHDAAKLGFSDAELEPARPGLARSYVRNLPLATAAQPLHALYLLHSHNQPQVRLTSLSGQERIRAVLAFAFDRQIPLAAGVRQQLFMQLCATLPHVRVVRVDRPERDGSIEQLAALLQEDWSR